MRDLNENVDDVYIITINKKTPPRENLQKKSIFSSPFDTKNLDMLIPYHHEKDQ